jgi:dihydrofolate reductase
MSRVIISEFVSLDGVMQAPGHLDEDRDGGFERGGWLMNDLPKFVASTTLEEPLTWSNSTLLKGDVGVEVVKLKDRSGGDLLVLGSGELAHTLMKHNLVDEYQLKVHPVVLGTGKRLFRDGESRKPLRLVDSTTTGTGVLLLTYMPEEGLRVDKR